MELTKITCEKSTVRFLQPKPLEKILVWVFKLPTICFAEHKGSIRFFKEESEGTKVEIKLSVWSESNLLT